MREKSSSVLTSFSSRSALRCATVELAACPRGGRLRAGERVLERAEHQRERRAELVAHVREERGLRAVDLRERLGAPPLLLVGASVGDRGRDLRGDELEEVA